MDLPCGKNTCITFYKSNHCLFCEPAFEILMELVQEFGLPSRSVEVVNVDDPSAQITENDVPVVPLIRLCRDHQVSGFVSDDQLRSALMGLMVKPCYPYNR
jgi:thiol-disulfide isomerase/thioredoxin